MADKEVLIGGKKMMYGTGVKDSPELSESSTKTFDGAVVQGMKDVPYVIEISRLRYDSMATHKELSEKVEDMMENPDVITIRETVRPKGEAPYQVIKNHFGCITTGNDYEIKPDDHTVENLKFKSSRRTTKYKKLKG